jgi:hypothetical protein
MQFTANFCPISQPLEIIQELISKIIILLFIYMETFVNFRLQ